MSEIDTIPLLRLLGGISNQTMSRGEAMRQGISELSITKAQAAGEIFIISVDNTRNGEKSLLATLSLTDVGESILDDQEFGGNK